MHFHNQIKIQGAFARGDLLLFKFLNKNLREASLLLLCVQPRAHISSHWDCGPIFIGSL